MSLQKAEMPRPTSRKGEPEMPSSNELRMAFVGDNFFVDCADMDSVYDSVIPVFRKSDILFGNLEMPLTDRGTPARDKPIKDFILRMDPGAIKALSRAKFDVVAITNNHMMNYGPEGLFQTLSLLDGANIAHAGAGRNLQEARKPAIVEKKGCRVGFLAYTTVYVPSFAATPDEAGEATFKVHTAYQPPPRVLEHPGAPPIVLTIPEPSDVESLKEDIAKLRSRADVIVVSWHWGVSESLRKIVDYQKVLGHICIDAGADLVIGHHPHSLQGIEIYKGRMIAYSLANFVAYTPIKKYWSHFDKESIILKCGILDKKIQNASFFPVLLNEQFQPELATGNAAKGIVDKMCQLCSEFGTKLEVKDKEISIVLS